MKETKIGVINWDGCLESDTTYFGSYCAKTLSGVKYVNRVPFYADVTEDNKVSFHKRTQEEFDREMEYAIEAGIDYFAYVWYTKRDKFAPGENVSETARHVHELTYIRGLHMASSFNEKLKMCAILSAHPITDEELSRLADVMKEPYYQYIEKRPLVYIYTGYDKELILRLRSACKEAGVSDPYVVIFTNNNPAAVGETYDEADGVSAYCVPNEDKDCDTTEDFVSYMLDMNDLMISYSLPVVPMFSVGWNPMPRIDTPVPWYGYANKRYASASDPEQIVLGAKALSEHLGKKNIQPKTVLSYAWNEFEEGGFICPTFDCKGGRDKSRLDAFREAAEYFRK